MFYVINYCDIYRILLTAKEYLSKQQNLNNGFISFKDNQLLDIIGYVMNQLDLSKAWYFVIEDAKMDNNEEE